MIRTPLRALALTALLWPSAWAQEAAVTRRALDLREAPAEQARSIASLPARTALSRTSERQGPWVQVRTSAGATGWVHLFDIGPAAAPAEGGNFASGALRGVTSLFGGSRPTQTGSTAGIRGLGAEDIANATPNPGALAQVDGWRVGETEARSFAERSAWRPAQVESLPQPARAPAGPGGNHPAQQESP